MVLSFNVLQCHSSSTFEAFRAWKLSWVIYFFFLVSVASLCPTLWNQSGPWAYKMYCSHWSAHLLMLFPVSRATSRLPHNRSAPLGELTVAHKCARVLNGVQAGGRTPLAAQLLGGGQSTTCLTNQCQHPYRRQPILHVSHAHLLKYSVYIDFNFTTSPKKKFSTVYPITSHTKHEQGKTVFSVFELLHMHACAYQCDHPPPTPALIIKVSLTVTHSNTNSAVLTHMYPVQCVHSLHLLTFLNICTWFDLAWKPLG